MIPDTLGQLAIIALVAFPLAVLFVAVGRRVRFRRLQDQSRDVALARLERLSMSDQEREAVIYWPLHNRACRRRLSKLGFGPSAPGHLLMCVCGGPASAFDRATAEMRQAS